MKEEREVVIQNATGLLLLKSVWKDEQVSLYVVCIVYVLLL